MGPVQLGAVGVVLLTILLRIHSSHACKVSEFPCRGGALCLPLDKYCDGRDDCGDASDEPKYCTGNSIYCVSLTPVPHIHLRSGGSTLDQTRLRIIIIILLNYAFKWGDHPRPPPPAATENISRQLHRIKFVHWLQHWCCWSCLCLGQCVLRCVHTGWLVGQSSGNYPEHYLAESILIGRGWIN